MWLLIYFSFTPFEPHRPPCISPGNSYAFMGLMVFVQSKKILFYIASILEYLFFFPDRKCITFSFKHAVFIGF